MPVVPLALPAGEPATAIAVARSLAFGAIAVAAAVLVYFMADDLPEIMVAPYEDRWYYLAVGVAAAFLYGVSGLVGLATGLPGVATFRTGGTLFFFLFAAAGVRAMYVTVAHDGTDPAEMAVSTVTWVAIIGAFIVAWWSAYLFGPEDVVALVTTVGLTGAVTYTLWFAVLTVRAAEGTSLAAVIRQFMPALVSFAVVVIAEQTGQYTTVDPGVVVGVELVGTTLAGAFLFTTAVAIRQQTGEVTRLYDQTTWRGQTLDEESAGE